MAGDWISESTHTVLTEHGITADPKKAARGMRAIHKRMVLENRIAGLSEADAIAKVEADIVRPGLNRYKRPVWQIDRAKIDLLSAWQEDEKDWLSATQHGPLSELGITSRTEAAARGMEAIYRRLVREKMADGANALQAQAEVEKETVRFGESQLGKPTWQMRLSKIDRLRDWVEEETHWISIANKDRHGITNGIETIEEAMAQLNRETRKQLMDGDLSEAKARLEVERVTCRKAPTPHSDGPIWQIRDSAIPALKAVLDSPWLNSHSYKTMRSYTIAAPAAEIDEAARNCEQNLIFKLVREQYKDYRAAEALVHKTMLHPTDSRYGNPSWAIHRDFMPQFIAAYPQLCIYREEEWMSARSPRLKELAPAGPGTLQEAMELLRQRKISGLEASMDPEDAEELVETTMVGMRPSRTGELSLKIHVSIVPELDALIKETPHLDQYRSRAGRKPRTNDDTGHEGR